MTPEDQATDRDRGQPAAAATAVDGDVGVGDGDVGVGVGDGDAPRVVPDDGEPAIGRWPRGAAIGALCLLALAVGVFLAATRDAGEVRAPDPDPALEPGDTVPPGHPSLDDSDRYESMTLAQLEAEVADESAPVSLRLTLAERYLSTGDIEAARDQARLARAQAATDVDQQRALRDLGWALALLGRPERGAELLEQALVMIPGERNATWYLANVRLAGLDDPDGAAELFRALLADGDLDADQRALVEARLAVAESASTTVAGG